MVYTFGMLHSCDRPAGFVRLSLSPKLSSPTGNVSAPVCVALHMRDRNGRAHRRASGEKVMATREDGHIVESTTEARGAVTGHNARYVLYWSIALVVVLFAAVFLYFFH